MALDAKKLADELDTWQKGVFDKMTESGSYMGQPQFLQEMSKIIDDHFQEAKPSMNNVLITPPKGSLLLPAGGATLQLPYCIQIASEIARYWTAAVGMGTPQLTFGIVSIVNDASKIITPLANAILGLCGKTEAVGYSEFAKAIVDEVLTIQWTVVEFNNPKRDATTNLTVSIS